MTGVQTCAFRSATHGKRNGISGREKRGLIALPDSIKADSVFGSRPFFVRFRGRSRCFVAQLRWCNGCSTVFICHIQGDGLFAHRSGEDAGAVLVDQHLMPQVVPDGTGQHQLFQVPALAHQIGYRIPVAYADDVLGDDGPAVQFGGDVVAGGADHLDPAFVGLVIGLGAGKGGQEGVMDIAIPNREIQY